MATEAPKKTRKPRTNYQAQHEKLIQYCRISLSVLNELMIPADPSIKEFFRGQCDALKAVLRQLGASEE